MPGPLSTARAALEDAVQKYNFLGEDAFPQITEDLKNIIEKKSTVSQALFLKSLMQSPTASTKALVIASLPAAAVAAVQEPAPASTPARGGAGAPPASTPARGGAGAPPASTPARSGASTAASLTWGDATETTTLEEWVTPPVRAKTFASAAAAAAPLVAKSTGGTKQPVSWKEDAEIHFTDYKSAPLGFKKLPKFNARVLERRALSEMHDYVFQAEDGFEDHIKDLSDEKFQILLKDTSSAGPIVTKVTELCPLFIDKHMKPMSSSNLDYVLHNGLGRFIWSEYDVDKFVYPETLREFFKIPADEAPSELQLRKAAVLDAIQSYMLKGTRRLLEKLQADHPGAFTICPHPQWSYTPFALSFKTKEDRQDLMNHIMNGTESS